MLKYINILLDDGSVSFCHYSIKRKPNPISEEILNKGILFAMKENLNIQFIFPRYDCPEYIEKSIKQVDHVCIGKNDVIVYDTLPEQFDIDKICVLRISKDFLFKISLPEQLPKRLDIVIIDVESFCDEDFLNYKIWLEREANKIRQKFHDVNILSDRLILEKMNNCNAGWESITLAPDGKFYICPAFYQDGLESVGDLENGLNIPNPQLYRLDHAPICSRCDAYQCKRCVWLNFKTTCEVNTPSHEQCVIAHLERNSSRIINSNNIPDIDYLDPFEKVQE